MQSFLCLFGIYGGPKCDKGATTVQTRVLVSNDSHILEWAKLIKGWEYVFFIQRFGYLGGQQGR